jgi:hypothetical protein
MTHAVENNRVDVIRYFHEQLKVNVKLCLAAEPSDLLTHQEITRDRCYCLIMAMRVGTLMLKYLLNDLY